ncbi:hypothetical protein RRG08_047687 [Elysia crispata]|uniref:Uncharacterized protein n=1 Tax=Elysia crispata TaxID=231223 RepID=A0AAE1BCF5_9GAST|nr:hypothetical protein RRG08_047687 [Elysia crispata]
MPLRFKTVFTRSRTARGLLGLFIAAICLRAPQFFAHGVSWKFNPATNSSYLSCSDAKDIQILSKVNDLVNRNIVSTITYFLVAACVVQGRAWGEPFENCGKFKTEIVVNHLRTVQIEGRNCGEPFENRGMFKVEIVVNHLRTVACSEQSLG